MKKTIVLTLLCALSTGMRAADYNYLVFTMTDGTQQAVTASNLSITFSDGNLVASSGSATLATIALSDLASMEFSNDSAAGITSISSSSLTIGDEAEVYDLNGRMMPKGMALPKGVYIIKQNGITTKTQVR